MDGLGGPLYIGTGCFHRRDTLCGRVFSKNQTTSNYWNRGNEHRFLEEASFDLQERLKNLASCTFEKDTQWGNEVPYLDSCVFIDVYDQLMTCNGKIVVK